MQALSRAGTRRKANEPTVTIRRPAAPRSDDTSRSELRARGVVVPAYLDDAVFAAAIFPESGARWTPLNEFELKLVKRFYGLQGERPKKLDQLAAEEKKSDRRDIENFLRDARAKLESFYHLGLWKNKGAAPEILNRKTDFAFLGFIKGKPKTFVLGLGKRGINTLQDLKDMSEAELLDMDRVGCKTFAKIKAFLVAYGLHLRPSGLRRR